MRGVAVLTALAFGCATARPQVVPGPLPIAERRIALLEPDVELWMEGTKAIDPDESARALEATHAAVAQALAGRALDATDPDGVLAVHVRGIARTSERRSAQVASIVGIVVVIVAIVVLAIVTSRSGSSPKGGHVAGPARSRLPGPRPGVPGYIARPYYPPPPIGVHFGIGVVIPIEPMPPPPWVNPTAAWLASRGWFDGDEVEVALDLMDARTGEVTWHEIVRGGFDPRDANALTGLVDRALAGQPFGARRAADAPSIGPGALPPAAPPVPFAPDPSPGPVGHGGTGKLLESPG